jgi:hypothetical protein
MLSTWLLVIEPDGILVRGKTVRSTISTTLAEIHFAPISQWRFVVVEPHGFDAAAIAALPRLVPRERPVGQTSDG